LGFETFGVYHLSGFESYSLVPCPVFQWIPPIKDWDFHPEVPGVRKRKEEELPLPFRPYGL
jgi:hypothetical protein